MIGKYLITKYHKDHISAALLLSLRSSFARDTVAAKFSLYGNDLSRSGLKYWNLRDYQHEGIEGVDNCNSTQADLLKCSIVILVFASVVNIVAATGPLNGLPILNGPINPIANQLPGAKTGLGDFVHPGLWHTHDDLERIRNGVLQGQDPWKTAYQNFSTDSFSQASVSLFLLPRSILSATANRK